jgi:hypothetical protein
LIAAVSHGAAPAAASAQAVPRVRVNLPAYPSAVAIDTIMLVTTHDAPAARVYRAAERAFAELKIPIDTRDSTIGVLGIKRFNKSTSLAGQPMSKLLNCGTGLTGPNADNFRISMAVITVSYPTAPDRAKLGVGFVGSAVDMRGSSSDPVACASTGWLENEIAIRVEKAIKVP